MKRGPLILTLVAGLLVFLAVLVLYLPASWFASRLPAQVSCGSLGGSIWQGECLGLSVSGSKLGDATWNLSPLAILRGRLSGDVDLRGAAVTARTRLELHRDGSGELTDLQAQFPLDPALSPQMPRDQRGLVVANFPRLVLSAGAAPAELQGTAELRDFRQVGAQPLELGSYRLTFDGQRRPDGTTVGRLNDIGGPFGVEGTVTFTPPATYVIRGLINGRTPQAQGIVRDITPGMPTDSAGRTEFVFENSF